MLTVVTTADFSGEVYLHAMLPHITLQELW
jgi:hypothetical protein